MEINYDGSVPRKNLLYVAIKPLIEYKYGQLVREKYLTVLLNKSERIYILIQKRTSGGVGTLRH